MNNKKNFSPWLHQLYEEKINREVKKVDSETETDILIVGAGIAGISTAYFLLKYTDKKIIIGIINIIINNFNNILIKIIHNNINLLNINKSYYRK